MRCSRCESSDVIDGLKVVDRGEDNAKYALKGELKMNLDAVFLKGAVAADLSAAVCTMAGDSLSEDSVTRRPVVPSTS